MRYEICIIQYQSLKLNKYIFPNETLVNYINTPRSIDSVKLLNTDYRTIEFDDFQQHYQTINDSDAGDANKHVNHFLNFVINCTSIFYRNQCNKPTWIRYKKDLYIDYSFPQMDDNNLKMIMLSNFYMLKTYYACLNGMNEPLEYMFSDKCKSKDILQHQNYFKGRDYFITALYACKTMIYELLIVNGFLLKACSTYIIDASCSDCNQKFTNILNVCFHHNLNVDEKDIKMITSAITKQPVNEVFKKTNKKLYIMILNLLEPCNFMMLVKRLCFYKRIYGFNIFCHRVMNNIEKPEYLGDNIKILCTIE